MVLVSGIAALLWRIRRPCVTVGVDGSLYRFHPRFQENMTKIIEQLRPQDTKVHIV